MHSNTVSHGHADSMYIKAHFCVVKLNMFSSLESLVVMALTISHLKTLQIWAFDSIKM